MKKLFIIGNWKSYKTLFDVNEWIDGISDFDFSGHESKEIIVCAPFTLLLQLKSLISEKNLPIKIGAQNISPFEEGAYTGEINGEQIKEFADYVIIGHSERRANFSETDEVLEKKVKLAREHGLKIIFCVQGSDTPIPEGVDVVAYEPIFAIGSGNPDTPENAESVAKKIKERAGVKFIIYGGSVKPENVNSFTSKILIDGVLPGGASLDPDKFSRIISNS